VDRRVSRPGVLQVSCPTPLPSVSEEIQALVEGKAYTRSGIKISASTHRSCRPTSALLASSGSISFSKSWNDSLISTTGESVKPIKYYELQKVRRAVDFSHTTYEILGQINHFNIVLFCYLDTKLIHVHRSLWKKHYQNVVV